jgi:hypothetical protein
MKRFIAILNDGSFVNVPATRMEITDDAIIAYDGDEIVAYADTGFTLTAYISDRKED